MFSKKVPVFVPILIVLAAGIHIFSRADRVVIDRYYSNGIYPYISRFLRFCFGWLPFSLGDLLYGGFICWLLYKLFRVAGLILKKKFTKELLWNITKRAFVLAISLYIVFNLLWGINYNRRGIATDFGFKDLQYSRDELKEIDSLLLYKVNESKKILAAHKSELKSSREVFDNAIEAYTAAQKEYPFLQYHTVSLKRSVWGWLGNYIGFTGYYNPLTGEAQVNTTVPLFLQPFTTCHEIGHQLGYAKEDEANFAGYLAASRSTDTFFHYSVYLDLFIYTNRNLYTLDSVAAKSFAKQLLPEVRSDLEEWRKFNLQHRTLVEPVSRWLYGKYLQGNQQPDGIFAYDRVTALLIAYYRKFGRI